VWQNVFPKVYFLREIYFIITTGKFRELSKAETFGRLYSCGFDVIGEKIINGKRFFVAEKIKEPIFDENPTYGPLISLKRYGKNGKLIKVYKLRSMYPFAEYLQDYVYRHNDLEKGGKFKNDFRVTSFGKIIRKLWLDELPMFLNVLKGEMKIVGVRPLSKHYFNLYSKELQQKRIQHKPGLIPPFYVDMPKTLEEIMASEMKYLEDYEKNGLLTDWKYFWKALYNIIIKRARSQ
jgi:lipopolysaccharide/colanic/teichoic acid biosynthesis glycosyltransferase